VHISRNILDIPDHAVAKLAAQQIVVFHRHDGLRIAFHVYNTLDDVGEVLGVLKQNSDLLVLEKTPTRLHSLRALAC